VSTSPRSEFPGGMVLVHEPRAVDVPAAFPPLAAHGLGQQELGRRPGLDRAVGWNWMNSRSTSAAPARQAMAMPSPVATGGLVVRLEEPARTARVAKPERPAREMTSTFLFLLPDDDRAGAPPLFDEQVCGEGEVDLLGAPASHGPCPMSTRRISWPVVALGVQDPALLCAASWVEGKPGPFLVELRAPS